MSSIIEYLVAYPLFILITALAGGDFFDFRVFWLFTLILVIATPGDSAEAPAARQVELAARTL